MIKEQIELLKSGDGFLNYIELFVSSEDGNHTNMAVSLVDLDHKDQVKITNLVIKALKAKLKEEEALTNNPDPSPPSESGNSARTASPQ